MKPALLIIDLQEGFSGGPNEPFFASAAETVNGALELFRAKKLPIVWIHQLSEKQGLAPGEPKFEMYSRLNRESDGFTVHKRFSNSFRETELGEILKSEGADTLVICGFKAQKCINETYCGALDRGYSAVLLKGAIATDEAEAIRIVERSCDSVPLRFLQKVLE